MKQVGHTIARKSRKEVSTVSGSANMNNRIVGKRRRRVLRSWYEFVEKERNELRIEENLEYARQRKNILSTLTTNKP
jgi:hypothetical protein